MKIGIFGGSFNPIHKGHIKIALTALNFYELDKILIIPLGIPSHKEDKLERDFSRLDMCNLAFERDELMKEEYDECFKSEIIEEEKIKMIKKIRVSDIEIKENRVSYTYDTLIKLKKEYQGAQFYEIIGEDSAVNFTKWKNYKEILKESKVVVFKRKNEEKKISNNNFSKKMEIVQAPYFQFSSTEIRNKIKRKENVSQLIPEKILNYIITKKLYL